MTRMTPDLLAEYAKMMHTHGVKRLDFRDMSTAGVFTLEIFPPTPAVQATNAAELAKALSESIERCECGHEVTEHGPGGLCLIGCPSDKCAQKVDPGKLADEQ